MGKDTGLKAIGGAVAIITSGLLYWSVSNDIKAWQAAKQTFEKMQASFDPAAAAQWQKVRNLEQNLRVLSTQFMQANLVKTNFKVNPLLSNLGGRWTFGIHAQQHYVIGDVISFDEFWSAIPATQKAALANLAADAGRPFGSAIGWVRSRNIPWAGPNPFPIPPRGAWRLFKASLWVAGIGLPGFGLAAGCLA